jgi:ABC-type bacteriocin/lantibiotic exporter with double-glycine peptidase domain
MPPLLKLPDIRQVSDYDCGVAASKVVLAYLGHTQRPKLPVTPIDGTDPRTIESAFRQLGLPVFSGQFDIPLLKHCAATDRPVICLVQQGGVGHYVVSAGVFRGTVFYQCPAEGPLSAKAASFLDSWHDADRFGTHFRCFGIAVGGE